MGRGRGKAKKSSIMAREDGSGEEEKLPVKRRGRPTKAQKEEEEEAEKMEYENKDTKVEESSLENGGNKRKKQCLESEESMETTVKDETNGDVLTKAVGFRQNGSRRKNKPHRAAEVGVSACEVCSWVALRS